MLFELPSVAASLRPATRLEIIAGDFFTDRLPAADAYILMNIVHDWDDERAGAILSAVADAGRRSESTVLVIETVLPEDAEPHWAKTLDALMPAITGGRERTQAQYERLFDGAGVDLSRTTATRTPFSIVEGRVRS